MSALAEAVEHYRAGRYAEAARGYLAVLREDPGNADATQLLGLVALRTGHPKDALELFDKALTLDRRLAPAMVNRALALRELGRCEEAEASLRRALRVRPELHEARRQLAALALDRRDGAGAEVLLRALPEDAATLYDLGAALLLQGREDDAIGCWMRTPLAREALARTLAARGDVRGAFHVEPSTWAAAFVDTIGREAEVSELLALYARDDVDHQRIEVASRGKVLEPWLRRTIVADADWERRFRDMRRRREGPLAALAEQAWNTEYAWWADPGEVSDGDPPEVRALYGPVEEVLPERFAELREEAVIEVPTIGRIVDETSLEVRRQYEENPYPRLVGFHRRRPESLAQSVAAMVSLRAGPISILVAGSGTGQHPLTVASRYADSEVLGIDLSRASLARATRLARKHRLDNLSFAQADILGLEGWERRFDFVDCVGVLHHLADPGRGGRVLAGSLSPGGILRLGLYSERGRSEVVAARALVAEHGWLPTADGIREARKWFLDLPPEHPAAGVTRSVDFYSLSGARDLLFHACEHRYSPLSAADLIEEIGLEVVGVQHAAPDGYRARRPGDDAMADLAVWEEVEAAEPRTFSGMMLVWCRGG